MAHHMVHKTPSHVLLDGLRRWFGGPRREREGGLDRRSDGGELVVAVGYMHLVFGWHPPLPSAGGGEMGRHWYEKEGKYLTKKNTFLDFISSAEHLIAKGYTSPSQLGIWGRSAGGLLVGAVVNMKPELFRWGGGG